MSQRSPVIRRMPCVACQIEGCAQPNPTEEHHLNLGGRAGQKRRGDAFSIPLCAYHHRGVPIDGVKLSDMSFYCGPSLALNSKAFRISYGTDDELLERTNQKLQSVA